MTRPDLGSLVDQARQRVEQAAALRQRLAELVGRAESADGQLKAAFTAADGLVDLSIDPRAMRMASGDLAQAIGQLVREAKSDLDAQTRRTVEETYGEGFDPAALVDPAALHKRLDSVSEAFHETTGDTTALLDAIRRKLAR